MAYIQLGQGNAADGEYGCLADVELLAEAAARLTDPNFLQ